METDVLAGIRCATAHLHIQLQMGRVTTANHAALVEACDLDVLGSTSGGGTAHRGLDRAKDNRMVVLVASYGAHTGVGTWIEATNVARKLDANGLVVMSTRARGTFSLDELGRGECSAYEGQNDHQGRDRRFHGQAIRRRWLMSA